MEATGKFEVIVKAMIKKKKLNMKEAMTRVAISGSGQNRCYQRIAPYVSEIVLKMYGADADRIDRAHK